MKTKLKSLLRLPLLILALLSANESFSADIIVGNLKSFPTDQNVNNRETMKKPKHEKEGLTRCLNICSGVKAMVR